MFDQMSLLDTRSVISLPASVDGRLRSAALDGTTAAQHGPARALASLSARQAKALGLLTSGTYGRPSITSSRSTALQSSLESRLRATTQTLGSTLYKMTWRPWITPSGRSRFRLVARALRKSESVFTGWPTPRATDGDKNIRTVAGALKEIKRKGSPQDIGQALLISGSSGSTAGNARSNPDFYRWLMRFPACWTSCAPTGTPSTPAPRKSSSNP